MNAFDRPFVDPANATRAGDEIDALLRRFFQAEMPDPWPKFHTPEEPSAPVAAPRGRGWTLFRSRLALAASVALLVGGNLVVSNAFRGEAPARSGGGTSDMVGSKPSRHTPPPSKPAPSSGAPTTVSTRSSR